MKNATIDQAQAVVKTRSDQVVSALGGKGWDELAGVFANAYQNSIRTTAEILVDSSENPIESYAGTGGWRAYGPPQDPLDFVKTPSIDQPETLKAYDDDTKGLLDAMWIRDACAQYHSYLGVFSSMPAGTAGVDDLARFIEGVVRTSSKFLIGSGLLENAKKDCIKVHAFNRNGTPNSAGHDYEPDTLAYLIMLASDYEEATGRSGHLDTHFWCAIEATLHILGENLVNFSNFDVPPSALTQTPFRPSDDPVGATMANKKGDRNYINIPINAFLARALEKAANLAFKYDAPRNIGDRAKQLGVLLRSGVTNLGIQTPPSGGDPIFAYEIDQRNPEQNPTFMDDAGIPSLLSLPYFTFCSLDDKVYRATREFILRKDEPEPGSGNPYFYTSTGPPPYAYEGIGSVHIELYAHLENRVWPMSIIMRGMTARPGVSGDDERRDALMMILRCSKVTYEESNWSNPVQETWKKYSPDHYVHESFDPDNVSQYTRGWFAWVNAQFGEWVETMVGAGTLPSFKRQ